ncbi:MAG: hypothetical protein J4N67_08550 [Chloroflexi bacterium]|nr:hypothetical protein [Chloroflexota bacterium]
MNANFLSNPGARHKMSNYFGIQDFIDNRWAEAKLELEMVAPTFFHALQAHEGLQKFGFVLPEALPVPEQRFAAPWHELLESTMDVTQAVERLNITLGLLEGVSEKNLAKYYYEVWLQSAYALCAKVESLIAHTCKVHSVRLELKREYQALVKSIVRDEIDKRRTAFVHGANRPDGKIAIVATVMTDHGYWEGAVFLGPEIIKGALAESNQSGWLSVHDYHAILTEITEIVFRGLGHVLEQVHQGVSS